MPEEPEFSHKLLLAKEKEIIGFYVSGHPLDDYQASLARMNLDRAGSLEDKQDGSRIKLAGIISNLRISVTRRGEKMAYLTLEDLTGNVEVLVFPKTFQNSIQLLQDDNLILLEGRLNSQEDEMKIFAETIKSLDAVIGDINDSAKSTESLYIRVKGAENQTEQLIRQVLKKIPGRSRVYVVYKDSRKVVLLNQELWVDLEDGDILEQLINMFGKENVCVK